MKNLDLSSRALDGKKDDIIVLMHDLFKVSERNAAGTEEISASVEEQTAVIEEKKIRVFTIVLLAQKSSLGRILNQRFILNKVGVIL